MILQQELINKIKDYFDLNVYETKVWLALLTKGVASVGEIASISKVPRSRVYDVLESLEKKGFTIVRMGKPVKYLGIKPELILERIKMDVKQEADEKIQTLSKVKETEEFNQLNELYRNGINPVKKEEISSSITGKSNISNFIRDIIRNAEKEVIICLDAEETKNKFKLFYETISILKDMKIKIKMALYGDVKLINELEKKFGIKIEKTEIKAKFFIVDKNQILFYITDDKKDKSQEDIAVWLNSDFFVESFVSLFEKTLK
jgi:sugar-specific transcriptional regulator TrmB